MPKFLCEFFAGNTMKCLDIVEAQDRKGAENQLDLQVLAMVDLISCREISEKVAEELKASGTLKPYPY